MKTRQITSPHIEPSVEREAEPLRRVTNRERERTDTLAKQRHYRENYPGTPDMLLFSPIQTVKENSILIPDHIRASLSFYEGTELYLSTVRGADAALRNEIIASQVPVRARHNMWRLRVAFRDRPGLMMELYQLLRELRIEIKSSRVTVLDQAQVVTAEVHFDAAFLPSSAEEHRGDESSAAGPTLPVVHARILAQFIADIDFPFGQKPLFSIRRNIPLFQSQEKLDDVGATVRLEKNRIELPQRLVFAIEESYAHTYPGVAGPAGARRYPLASVVADTEGALLRIMILYPNTGHIHIRLRSRNTVDCLSEITAALLKRGFNILRMYTRMVGSREELLTDFLLHLRPERDEIRNDARLKKYVLSIAKDKEMKGLGLAITFPPKLPHRKTPQRAR